MRVDFHAFPKSCCTILHELNVSDVKIMKIMRHSDINLTVNTYNDLNRLGFHEAIESLAPSKELTAILTDSSDFSCQNMSFSDQNKKLEEQNLKCSKTIKLHVVSRYDNERKTGRGSEIRTRDLLLPKQTRYQLRYAPDGVPLK